MTPKQKQQIVDRALSLIDRDTEPSIIAKNEAKAVLEQIITELESRIDCINDELKVEER